MLSAVITFQGNSSSGVLWPAFQGDELGACGPGDLLQFGHSQMIAIHLEIDAADGYDSVSRCLSAFSDLLSFPEENFS